jgi:hypothetical protein
MISPDEISRNQGWDACASSLGLSVPSAGSRSSSIERWWQQLEAAEKHTEGPFRAIDVLAMAASYDPDPAQFLGIRLPVTFDTCEVTDAMLAFPLPNSHMSLRSEARGKPNIRIRWRAGFRRSII